MLQRFEPGTASTLRLWPGEDAAARVHGAFATVSEAKTSVVERYQTLPWPVRGCCRCGFWIVGIFVVLFVLLWAAVLSTVSVKKLARAGVADTCALQDYDIEDLATGEAMEIGTPDNVIGSYFNTKKNFDLTGLWWLQWDDPDLFAAYGWQRIEIAVSFAQSTLEVEDDTYPNTLRVPGAAGNRLWGYSDGYWALPTIYWHAFSWCKECEEAKSKGGIGQALLFDFENKTNAQIRHIDGFAKINEDQWLRPNFNHSSDYKLTRIVYADGTKHAKWWPLFAAVMKGYKVRVWNDDNICKRRCESLLLYFGSVPAWMACSTCASSCR